MIYVLVGYLEQLAHSKRNSTTANDLKKRFKIIANKVVFLLAVMGWRKAKSRAL